MPLAGSINFTETDPDTTSRDAAQTGYTFVKNSTGISVDQGASIKVENIKFQHEITTGLNAPNSSSVTQFVHALSSSNGSYVEIDNLEFGDLPRYNSMTIWRIGRHMAVFGSARIWTFGAYKISGGAYSHMEVDTNSSFGNWWQNTFDGIDLNISVVNTPGFTIFARASNFSSIIMPDSGVQITGTFGTTSYKYECSGFSKIIGYGKFPGTNETNNPVIAADNYGFVTPNL